MISADSAVDDGGTILLLATGAAVQADGEISASSQQAAGDSVAISGSSVTIGAGTQILASGASSGGSIAVGGDLHGGNLPLAATTTVEAGAVLNASATVKGNGGNIEVVSDTSNAASATDVSGILVAKGGAAGGNGGKIETFGATLNTSGITVEAAAPKGEAGQWLLDPTMIEIGSTTSGVTSSSSGNTDTYTGTGTSYVSATTIDTALDAGTNVVVQTSGLANSGAFDIWVDLADREDFRRKCDADAAGGQPEAQQTDAAGPRTAGGFDVLTLQLTRTQLLPESFLLQASASGQIADKNLDSSQQFHLGGPSGVLGYAVGDGGGDDGYLADLELSHRIPLPELAGVLRAGLLAQYGRIRVNHHDYAGYGSPNVLTQSALGPKIIYAWRGWSMTAAYGGRIGSHDRAGAASDTMGQFWFTVGKSFQALEGGGRP